MLTKKVWIFAGLRRIFLAPRGICLLLSAAAMNASYLLGIRHALLADEKMSVLTPMLLLLSSPQVFPSPHFFMSAFTFFLFSQIPFADQALCYHMIRSDKKTFVRQQIVLIMLANALLIALFIVSSWAVMWPHLSPQIHWDRDLFTWQEMQAGAWYVSIPYAVTYQAGIEQAFFIALGLWWLYSVGGGLLLFAARLFLPKVRNAGIGILFCVYFYDYLCEYFLPYSARKYSPVALSRISYLNWGYDPQYPSIGYAFLFFVVVCVALILALSLFCRRMDLDALSSRTYRE